ncbi:uncharacterized protein RJT20DRAFT_126204 [Scheffersomyces xylosifermentans]|uniref:uncharacterized protein n=1 Tax=Scheffersomyces xylosifermentans TaxID=1304137 RepID=UPI00315CFB01
MAPPKKNIKMDLGSFLADESLGGGSWADEEVDLNSIGVSTAAPIERGSGFGSSDRFGGDRFGGDRFGGDRFGGERGGFEERRERKEFPIPDQPPYRARVANLPWEITEDAVIRHFEDRMQAQNIITDIKLPVDRENGRLKGFAFVTFSERALLEEALNLNLSDFEGRKIFVNVAAPQRAEFDNDWRSGRSGPMTGGREPREEVDLDWGSARNSKATLPPRERSYRDREGGERPERADRPPREEVNLDWGSARHEKATLPPRERSFRDRGDRPEGERPERSERPPRKEEPDLDWGSARTEKATLPPRERSFRSDRGDRPERTERPRKEEPELDWGAARTTKSTLPPREKSFRSERGERGERGDRAPKKQEPEMDWRRGQPLPPKAPRTNSKKVEAKKEEQPKPQKSSFSVLALEGDSDEEEGEGEEEKEEKPEQEQQPAQNEESGLESATADLSVEDNKDNDGWEVVTK